MGKIVIITEKPSVAREFAKALKYNMKNKDGYLESEEAIVTWCVGHLVTMSYPDAYDASLKRWSLETIPFIPQEYKYEVIENVKKQFKIVKEIFNRKDIDVIYNAGDSGREGEYIQRLVLQEAGYNPNVKLKRIWIDSQTEDEILRGIREAKDLSAFDNLSAAAYLRAKEDYLMGINFSRVLSLKYSQSIKSYLKLDRAVVSVGRVMTCVLGMVVKREREIRKFEKIPFYRILGKFLVGEKEFEGEWRGVEGSKYYLSPLLYKENGFKLEETAKELIALLESEPKEEPIIESMNKKKELKNPPLLYNLAELQNDCSKLFKITPDETLKIIQELYEKKLVTYPRTDARVLSTAVAKEIDKNLRGLKNYIYGKEYAEEILQLGSYKNLAKTRYVNDKQITDHYAIIPTGQGLSALNAVPPTTLKIYEVITRRFLSIFYPPATYQKITLVTVIKDEKFFSSFKVLLDEGYFKVAALSFMKKKQEKDNSDQKENNTNKEESNKTENLEDDMKCDEAFMSVLSGLKKGMKLPLQSLTIKEGETSPPKRYNSGGMILAMENAGQLIEDEELRSQMKGSGIGTSATRAEILKKLVNIDYLGLNKKTQIIMPSLMGEIIYDVVDNSIRPLLDPALTASWEKGLMLVSDGNITTEEYMKKLDDFVRRRTNHVKTLMNQRNLYVQFDAVAVYYKK